MKARSNSRTGVPSPFLASLVSVMVLCRTAFSQYSSDQCSWKGSGLTHESHARDVEQVYLRCSQGSLEWLYPLGAVIVNLRPNTASPAANRLTVCVKPAEDSRGTNIYLDRAGTLRLLLTEREQAMGQVHCFGIQEGALFIEAIPHRDISRRITAFQYELVNARQGADSLTDPCQPCSDEEVLLAVCTSDFVFGAEHGAGQLSVAVTLTWLYRQKSRVFLPGGGRPWRWTGQVKMPPQCRLGFGEGEELLLTGTVRFGEAWLGCTQQYKDFLKLYREAQEQGVNPCQVETD
ncbi:hypothetical protein MATL_G00219370 [Megalops atlanticus]|uniref:Meteorin-like protein n=1 Tax=Megalops atlanticus TaxID=7932 RepID=A0A9D3SY69_MEGAT|nr:hypothetical protein MATL_G00219370 [Megalops atlanticus]